MNSIRRSPCYDCSGRHTGCHSECEDYANYRRRIEAISKEQKKETVLNYIDALRKLNAKSNEQKAYQRRKAGKKDGYSNRDSG